MLNGTGKVLQLVIGRGIRFGFLAILILSVSDIAIAAAQTKKTDNSDPISEGLTHLLDIAEKEVQTKFNPGLVEPVLDFVASEKKPSVRLDVNTVNKATGAYGEFTVRKSIKQILKLEFRKLLSSYREEL